MKGLNNFTCVARVYHVYLSFAGKHTRVKVLAQMKRCIVLGDVMLKYKSLFFFDPSVFSVHL